MQNQTSQERAQIMDAILTKSIIDKLIQLKFRWADEKEYEDFNEYKQIITNKIIAVAPLGTKVLKISKAFTIQLEIPNFPYKPEIFLNSHIGWRQSK